MTRKRDPQTPKVTEEPTKPSIMVREKGTLVRIRAEADIKSAHVDGKYLGKEWKEIDDTKAGPGSSKGWGHLADGSGWVALDFVEIMK